MEVISTSATCPHAESSQGLASYTAVYLICGHGWGGLHQVRFLAVNSYVSHKIHWLCISVVQIVVQQLNLFLKGVLTRRISYSCLPFLGCENMLCMNMVWQHASQLPSFMSFVIDVMSP